MPNFLKSLACLAAVCLSSSVHASLLFTIDRFSDRTASVSASGALDEVSPPQFNNHLIIFEDLFGSPLSALYENAFQSSTMQAGGPSIDLAYTASAASHFLLSRKDGLYMGSGYPSPHPLFTSGNTITGVLNLALPSDAIFAGVGTTGAVYWGPGFSQNIKIGSYVIVADTAVPEPTSVALFGLGLLGFVALRRKSPK